jgi:hypothetical protein
VVLTALLAGCGGSGGSRADDLADTLGYVPRDAHLVTLVPTDLDGDQWRRFGKLVAPQLKGSEFPTIRDNMRGAIPDVDFDHELAPLLGGTLVIAAYGPPTSEARVLAVLHTPDADGAQRVAAGVRNGEAIADGKTLVVELDGGNHELDAAVDRHEAGTGMDADTFAARFGDGAEDDALVRLLTDDEPFVPGLKSAALEVRLDSDAVRLHVRTRAEDSRDPEAVLEALAAGGLHRYPASGTLYGLIGDRFVLGHDDSVRFAPLGEPTVDEHASGGYVESELTVPVRDGLD